MTLARIIIAGLLLGTTARAENAGRAEDHFREGHAHANVGRYADAVREFLLAYECAPRAVTLYNLAEVYRGRARQQHRLDDAGLAVDYFRLYLRWSMGATPPRPADDRATVEEILASLIKEYPGLLERPQLAGTVAAEFQRLRKLETGAGPPDPACVTAPPAPSPGSIVVMAPREPRPPAGRMPWLSTRRKLGLALLGLGAGAAAGTIAGAVLSSQAATDWYVPCGLRNPSMVEETAGCLEARTGFYLKQGLAVAGGIVAVGAIAGSVLLLSMPRARAAGTERRARIQLGWTVDLGRVGVTAAGSF